MIVMAAGLLATMARLGAAPAVTDMVVETISDERIVGRVVEEQSDFVVVASLTFGELKIPRAQIRSLTALNPGPLQATPPAAPTAVPASPVVAGVVPAGPKAPAKSALRTWLHLPETFTATLGAGFANRTGLIDQRSYTVSLTVGWQSGANTFNSAFQYQYMKAGPLLAADDFSWDNFYQRDLGKRNFVLVGARYRQDRVAAVDYELMLFPALGRYLVKTPKVEIGVAAGPSLLCQDFAAVAPGLPDSPSTRDVGATGYQYFQYRVLPRVQIVQNNLFTQSLENEEKYTYRLLLSVNVALTEHLSLVHMYGYGYDSLPAPGTPKGQDSLSAQLSYQF